MKRPVKNPVFFFFRDNLPGSWKKVTFHDNFLGKFPIRIGMNKRK